MKRATKPGKNRAKAVRRERRSMMTGSTRRRILRRRISTRMMRTLGTVAIVGGRRRRIRALSSWILR